MVFRLKVIASALALGIFATASYAADPIKIGVDGPFTGGSSSMGVSMRDGVRLATAEINKAGGVLGRQLVLVERDDEAKNERGVQIAQELIDKEKVVAAVGYINTGVALASQRFFEEAKIPVPVKKPRDSRNCLVAELSGPVAPLSGTPGLIEPFVTASLMTEAPTMNQAPPSAPSSAPSTPTARCEARTTSSPPSTAAAPGTIDSHSRPDV